MDTLIYHAACEDGFCSALFFKFVYPDAELIPWNYYYDGCPDVTGKDVLIADFSFKRPILLDMAAKAKSLRVLDHHATAEKHLAGLDFCTFDMSKSGARLTWEFLFDELRDKMSNTGIWWGPKTEHIPIGELTKENPHWLVKYVEDRDIWLHKLPHTDAINTYIRSQPMDFDVWEDMARGNPNSYIAPGEAIERYKKKLVDTHVYFAFDAVIDGVPCKACQCTAADLWSDIGHALSKDCAFGAIYSDIVIKEQGEFKNIRSISLRSRDDAPPVLPICEKFGGGGHPHAANFKMTPDEIGGVKFRDLRMPEVHHRNSSQMSLRDWLRSLPILRFLFPT